MDTFKVAVTRQPWAKIPKPAKDADSNEVERIRELYRQLNGNFENVEISTNDFTRRIEQGYAYTTQHSQGWRDSANYLYGQHLALDFDDGDQSARFDTLLQNHFIIEYATLLHTTPSHTPQEPRSRVVFVLDTPIFQAHNYAAAAAALVWEFGRADQACKDPARFFYGAQGCETFLLDRRLPLSVVQALIREHGSAIQAERNERNERRQQQLDDVPETDEIRDALRFIPRQQAYGEWLKVLMSVHGVYPNDTGIALVEEWSPGYDGEVAKKFRSFGDGTGVTVASLFWMARQHGWKPDKEIEKRSNAFVMAAVLA